MDHREIKHKGITSAIWGVLGKFSTHLVTFIVSLILSRLLTPADFGMVGMAMVFIYFTQTFMDFGLTSAVIQKKHPTETQISTVFYVGIILSVILMLIMILCAPLIGKFYHNEEVGKIARFVSYSYVILALTGLQRALLSKQLEIRLIIIITIIGTAIQAVSGVILACYGFGAWSLVYSTFLNNVVTTILLWIKSSWRPKWLFSLPEIKDMFAFGSKMFVAGILESVYVKLDEMVIGKMFNESTLGYYHRSKSFNNLVVAYTSEGLRSVFFPIMSHLQDDLASVKKVILKSMEMVCFIAFALTAILYLDAKPLIVILFGDQWLSSVGYFQILAFVAYAYPVSIILVNVLSGLGKSGQFLKLEIWKKVVGLCGMTVGFIWGINGFLWANVGINAVGITLNMWFVGKYVDLTIADQWKIILKYAFIALLSALPVWLLNLVLPPNLWLLLTVDTLLFLVFYLGANRMMQMKGFTFVKDIVTSRFGNILIRRFGK
ncbi:MAG: lipopolysaccharide biosynthesis protein [Prevotellaceae bacterium]|jgi:O-antigen/teichoic acid export membrane protein|nr:lipopolysaccharide biosynthesis protein [Prevotellaceae bacterium]